MVYGLMVEMGDNETQDHAHESCPEVLYEDVDVSFLLY